MTYRFRKNQKVYIYAKVLLLIGAVPFFLMTQLTHGAQLSNRSLRLNTTLASATAIHNFKFDIQTLSLLGSIELEYCTNDPFMGTPCTVPAGLLLGGASIDSQSGETGFTIDPSSTANRLILTRVPVPSSPQPVAYSFKDVINPSASNKTVFVRISTFASADATGPRVDTGAVVFSTASGLGVGGFVPPYLTFCVGITVGGDCNSTVGSKINLGFLTKNLASAGTSQFAGATNDPTGYSVSIIGTTMTSGTNVIPALTSPTPSAVGTSQFGVNLRANTSPNSGQDPIGIGTAAVATGYDQTNRFQFINGDMLTNSPITTDFNTFTVTYMVNVSGAQPPGVYSSTFTYVATASF